MAFLTSIILPVMLFKSLFIFTHLDFCMIIHQSAQEQLLGPASDVKGESSEIDAKDGREDTVEDEGVEGSGQIWN